EWPARPTRNVDKISTLAFSSCNLFERHNIGHLIEGYQEPLVETWPVRIARARGAAMSVDQRKRHEFSSTGGRIGEANGKAAAQRLEVIKQHATIALAGAEAHLREDAVEKRAHLIYLGGRCDQLEAAEVVALGHAVDHICVVDGAQFAR